MSEDAAARAAGRAPAGGPAAFLEIVRSGVACVRHHPLRHVATGLAVVALLVPYLVGVAVARGLTEQARDSVAHGADLYVGAERSGLATPVPGQVRELVAAVPGVASVTPRIVVPVYLGKREEPVVLVGVPEPHTDDPASILRGRLPQAENEIVVGSVLARELGLDVGSRVPPFYRSASGERVSTVVGVFREDAPIWQARVMLCTLGTAARVVDDPDASTDLLVRCSDDPAAVAEAVRRVDTGPAGPVLRVATRDDVDLAATRDLLHVEGVYHALFALVLAAGIPILLVTSGAGLRSRRAETGLLRATGWRVDEVLLRAVAEHVTVAAVAGLVSLGLAWTWLAVLGGWGIAPVFLHGATVEPGFVVPYRLTPAPVLLGLALAHALVLAGSVSATWRAAAVTPARAMQ